MSDDKLTPWPAEAGDPATLPTRIAPPDYLEDIIVDQLRTEGQIEPAPAGRSLRSFTLLQGIAGLAACVLFVTLGIAIGRSTAPPVGATGAETDLYALLLYETEGYDAPVGREALTRYSEYSRWVAQAAMRDQFFDGHDFAVDKGWLLKPEDSKVTVVPGLSVAGDAALSGVFFIRADNAEHALALARELPHLKHGGQVIVQKTIPTANPPDIH